MCAARCPAGREPRGEPRATRGRRPRRRVAAALLFAAVFAVGAARPALAETSGFRWVHHLVDVPFDALVLRPLGAGQLALGGAFFVPAAILAAPGGGDAIGEAWERFVGVHVEETLERPIGEF